MCPILMGDLPYQHRFFDAAVAGCLPLWVRSNQTLTTGGTCEVWSYDARWTEDLKAHTQPSGYACAQATYPFPSTIDYQSFGFYIDSDGPGDACRKRWSCKEPPAAKFDRDVLDLSTRRRGDMRVHRARLERVRSLFVYDWSGMSYDAFSATLHEMCSALGK